MQEPGDHRRGQLKDSPDFKAKYPFVHWREMSYIRNKIIHHYFGVDNDIVWDTVKTYIPRCMIVLRS